MAHRFHLPDIGEGLAEATIVAWYVEVGGRVGLDEPLVQVETDKAVVDIPSPYAGVLLHRGGAAGEVLEVDDLLAVVGEEGESWEPDAPASRPAAPAAPIVGRLEEAPEVLPAGGPLQALPAVRKLAADLGIDLAGVAGSGPGGRVTEEDVRTAADGSGGPVETVRLSATRRAIAENLARSWREIPHVTTYGSADAAALLAARKALAAASGGPAPLEALLGHVVVPVLRAFPEFNATLTGDTLRLKGYHDLGFAVDSPDGLMVAVVKGAGDMDVATLAREIARLAAAVRDRTAAPDQMRGQTFTVSNIGAVGGRYGTPIVPYGTTAIVSFGRAEVVPVVRDGAVTVATELPISLSYDHRVIDGAKGRAFLGALVTAIEAIEPSWAGTLGGEVRRT